MAQNGVSSTQDLWDGPEWGELIQPRTFWDGPELQAHSVVNIEGARRQWRTRRNIYAFLWKHRFYYEIKVSGSDIFTNHQ